MVGAAIYDLLSNDAGVSALVSSRIYPDIAPQNVAYPFIVYTHDGLNPSLSKDGNSNMDRVEVSLVVYAESYDTSQAIATASRAVLDWASGTYGGVSIQRARLANQQSMRMDIDKHIYIVEQVYEIRVNG